MWPQTIRPFQVVVAFLATLPATSSAFANARVVDNSRHVLNAEESRGPWEFGRAARTAIFFGGVPKPPNPIKVVQKLIGGGGPRQNIAPGEVMYTPTGNPLKLQWGSLDDVVMGGASKSSLNEATGVWSGTIITAGGGFAGVRTKLLVPPLDLSACSGVVLRVSGGKGQRVKLILRDDEDWNGVAWTQSFDTAANGGVAEIKLPFSTFVPTKYARVVEGLRGLNTQQVTAFQLTYSKFEYNGDLNPNFSGGPFEFKIEKIGAF